MRWIFKGQPEGRHCNECGELLSAEEIRHGDVRIDERQRLHHKRCLDAQDYHSRSTARTDANTDSKR